MPNQSEGYAPAITACLIPTICQMQTEPHSAQRSADEDECVTDRGLL